MAGTRQHPAEKFIDWAAPAALAAAAGWSAWQILGMPAAGAGFGALAFAVGLLAIKLIGRQPTGRGDAVFEPLPFEEVQNDELLLDDPLVDVEPDSRVVRLFDRDEVTPGELVARIEDYLGDGHRRAIPAEEGSAAPPDASAALHAALANIRASLR